MEKHFTQTLPAVLFTKHSDKGVTEGASLAWKRIEDTDRYQAWWMGKPVIGLNGKQTELGYEFLARLPKGKLTDSQKTIVNNIRAGKEVFYSPSNEDIKHLIDAEIIKFTGGKYVIIDQSY